MHSKRRGGQPASKIAAERTADNEYCAWAPTVRSCNNVDALVAMPLRRLCVPDVLEGWSHAVSTTVPQRERITRHAYADVDAPLLRYTRWRSNGATLLSRIEVRRIADYTRMK